MIDLSKFYSKEYNIEVKISISNIKNTLVIDYDIYNFLITLLDKYKHVIVYEDTEKLNDKHAIIKKVLDKFMLNDFERFEYRARETRRKEVIKETKAVLKMNKKDSYCINLLNSFEKKAILLAKEEAIKRNKLGVDVARFGTDRTVKFSFSKDMFKLNERRDK